jgi:L-amino acid N-acyltransferase YncA
MAAQHTIDPMATHRVRVRDASEADVPRIADIYNHEVASTTTTLDTDPVTVDDRRQWLARRDPRRHPALVAELAGEVVGWGELKPWSPRGGYARTAEVSLFVAHDRRRAGAGRALLGELVARARAAGLGVLLSRIGGDSAASIELHRALGFRHLCRMERVGEKFGRVLDVELFDLQLG